MKVTVSFDIDDVIADFHKKFRAVAHQHFPNKSPFPESNGWDQPNWKLTDSERTMLGFIWKTQPNFYLDLDACPGVDFEWLRDLNERVNLIFVSSRHSCSVGLSAHEQSVCWFADHGIADAKVVITEHKVPVLRAAQAIAHVDDRTKIVSDLWDAGGICSILWRTCQNRYDYRYAEKCPVKESWRDLKFFVEMLLSDTFEAASFLSRTKVL